MLEFPSIGFGVDDVLFFRVSRDLRLPADLLLLPQSLAIGPYLKGQGT